MINKARKPGLVTITEFSRAIGVSQSAVSQAIQSGRLRPYDAFGRPVNPDNFRGRKFLKLKEATHEFEWNRVRFDDWWLERHEG